MNPTRAPFAPHGHAARAGYSLVELMFSLLLLSALISGATLLATTTSAAHVQSSSVAEQNARAARSVREIVARLRAADTNSLFPTPGTEFGTDELAFRALFAGPSGDVQWGPIARFQLVPEPGEPDDGLDNDGDGLVDERRILFIPDIDLPERRILVAHGVSELLEGELLNGEDDNGNGLIDEAGLCFSEEGGILTVRVSAAGSSGDERVTLRTAEQSLRLRN